STHGASAARPCAPSLRDALPILRWLDVEIAAMARLVAAEPDLPVARRFADGWLQIEKVEISAVPLDSEPRWPYAVFARYLGVTRSEEHTSELQSRENLVCRLLLE